MQKYEYTTVYFSNSDTTQRDLKSCLNDYAKKGFRYKGSVPTGGGNYLIFERPLVDHLCN